MKNEITEVKQVMEVFAFDTEGPGETAIRLGVLVEGIEESLLALEQMTSKSDASIDAAFHLREAKKALLSL